MQKLAHFVKVDWWDGSHILTSLFSPIKFTVNFQLQNQWWRLHPHLLLMLEWDIFVCFSNSVVPERSERKASMLNHWFSWFLFTFLKDYPLKEMLLDSLFFFRKRLNKCVAMSLDGHSWQSPSIKKFGHSTSQQQPSWQHYKLSFSREYLLAT